MGMFDRNEQTTTNSEHIDNSTIAGTGTNVYNIAGGDFSLMQNLTSPEAGFRPVSALSDANPPGAVTDYKKYLPMAAFALLGLIAFKKFA